jgi:LEA14-like dessication related protein
MRKFHLYILLLAVFTLNSCMNKPVFIGVNSVKLDQLKDSTLKAETGIKIYNPNSLSFTISSSQLTTIYKNIIVGNSDVNQEFTLKPHDTTTVPIVSTINLLSLSGVFPDLLSSDSATFSIKGNTKIKSWGISWNEPLNEHIKLNIKQVIAQQIAKIFQNGQNFKISGLKFARAPGLHTTALSMNIELNNAFPFNYSLNSLNLNFYRTHSRAAFGNWKLVDTIKFTAGSKSEVPVNLEINNVNLLSQTRLSDILHPRWNITMAGTAEVAINGRSFSIPINQATSVDLNTLTGIKL